MILKIKSNDYGSKPRFDLVKLYFLNKPILKNIELEKWPNFFIVGAPKAGTTSLYEYLKNIPEIYMSPIKEPNYFNRKTMYDEHPARKVRTKEKYLKLFRNVKDQKIIGEASGYMRDPDAPKLIHKIIPHAKILISLRDPVERAYSDYLMLVGHGIITTSFRYEIESELQNGSNPSQWGIKLDSGFYTIQLERYLKVFGHEQVKIIIFEEFIKDPKNTLNDILQFLGLKKSIVNIDIKKYNPYKTPRGKLAQKIVTNKKIKRISERLFPVSMRKFIGRKILLVEKPKPNVPEKDRETLIKLYLDDVRQLEKILGRKLPWNNFLQVF